MYGLEIFYNMFHGTFTRNVYLKNERGGMQVYRRRAVSIRCDQVEICHRIVTSCCHC